MCHERRPFALSGRDSPPLLADGLRTTPGLSLNNLRPDQQKFGVLDLGRLSPAALDKLIATLERQPNRTEDRQRLLIQAKAFRDAGGAKENIIGPGLEVDPELAKKRARLDVDRKPAYFPGISEVGDFLKDTAEGSMDTPGAGLVRTEPLKKIIGGVPGRVIDWLFPTEPLNSGGDVIPTGPLGPTKQGPKNDNPPGPTRPALPR